MRYRLKLNNIVKGIEKTFEPNPLYSYVFTFTYIAFVEIRFTLQPALYRQAQRDYACAVRVQICPILNW